jgi:flagellar motility protein MotE (MotC chaperone)
MSRAAISGAPRLLPVVIVGLAAMLLFRAANLWVGFSEAGAEETPPAEATPQSTPAAPPPKHAPRPGSVEERILTQLGDRRAALDQREAALETREALLLAAEAQIAARLSALKEKEKSLDARTAEDEARKDEQFARLSDAYERMKPRDAARIFETLDSALLKPVAAGMRTQSLAAVLSEMKSDKARELTELLAERRAATKAEAKAP